MAVITRKYPGKADAEIFARVDAVMADVARRHSLQYERDPVAMTGSVRLMGATGAFAVQGGQVTIDLKYPLLIPGAMRRKVEGDIEAKLDGLF